MKKLTKKGLAMSSCVPFRSCNQQVEYVDKRHQSLNCIPEETFRYARTLEELLLDANHIKTIPNQLTLLTRLRRLCISDNELSDLPVNLGNLVNLAELDVSRNEIHTIPASIRGLVRLRHLDLSSNPITGLPASFCELKSLTILTLNDTALTELPSDFGNLTSLISIELRENALRTLPSSFEHLVNLERLDLGDNELTDLPPFIGQLTRLNELWLDHNLLFRLPKEMGNLANLVCLDVSENQIDELPDELLSNLHKLTDFIGSQNNLDRIPPTIGQLTNLTVLKLESNKLSKIHPNIRYCTKLQELFLKENLLEELGDWVSNLVNLKILNMDCNRITTITEKIENLKELGVLSLRVNLLERLPDELGSCIKLMVLDFSSNRLQYLPFTITSLPMLKAVWLSENQSQPMPNFSTDCNVINEPVLTCYLLPQMPNDATQASLSLKGSSTLYRASGDLNLSLNGDIPKNALPISPETFPDQISSLTAGGDETKFKYGRDLEDDYEPHMETTRTSMVKFQDGSDDESSAEAESTFTRHNTPHPKDLKAKFQRWFGGSSKEKQKPKQADKVAFTSDVNENSKGPFRPERQKLETPPVGVKFGGVVVEEKASPTPSKELSNEVLPPAATIIEEAKEPEMEENDGEMSEDQYEEKHVGFIMEGVGEVEEEEDQDEKINLRLKRRDTPHHLKNKRINPEISTDADAIRAILERVKLKPGEEESESNAQGVDTTDSKDRDSGVVAPIEQLVTFQLTLNRTEGHPFGLNIAGGLGSSPFVDNDQSIFISKVVPGGLAERAGLKAGDRVLDVNGVDFTNIEHMQAVDAIRKAGNRIVFSVERRIAQNSLEEQEIRPQAIIPSRAQTGGTIGDYTSTNLGALKSNLRTLGERPNSVASNTSSSAPKSPKPYPSSPSPSFGSKMGGGGEERDPSKAAVVTVTIKQPDMIPKVPELFPPPPTDLGTVTETITKSTLTETVFTRVTQNEPALVPTETEDLVFEKKKGESLGVKIVSGTNDDCFPFGNHSGGVYVVYADKDGLGYRAGLRIGHRILEINEKMVDPTDKNRIAQSLLEAGDKIKLKIRKHPPPVGFMELELLRKEGEPLGMHIKGGVDNPGNPLDKNDFGIFISKILPNGAIYRNALLKVGMRILAVNGTPLINNQHIEAVGALRGAGSRIEMIVSNGYDPKIVDRMRAEGKLPDKIVEILSNSEEAAAASANLIGKGVPQNQLALKSDGHLLNEDKNKGLIQKPSVDKVMEVIKAAEQLVTPGSPTGSKNTAIGSSGSQPSSSSSATTTSSSLVPKSPTNFDVKKTTILMSGHSTTSPTSLGSKKMFGDVREEAVYANIMDLHSGKVRSAPGGEGDEEDIEFIDDNEPSESVNGGGKQNGGVGEKIEAKNPIFSFQGGPIRSSGSAPPPIPTPRTSLGSSSRHSPIPNEEESHSQSQQPPSAAGAPIQERPLELRVKIKDMANLASSEGTEDDTEDEAVFQFQPEFHRVPSPIVHTPQHAYIPPEATGSLPPLKKSPTPQEKDKGPIRRMEKPPPAPKPTFSTFGYSSSSHLPPPPPPPHSSLPKEKKKDEEPTEKQFAEEIVQETSTITTSKSTTSSTFRSNVVSARAKFFEKEIQQLTQPASKTDKKFSFLSQHEVDQMREEEDQKIATSSYPPTSSATTLDHGLMRSMSELEKVEEEEETQKEEEELKVDDESEDEEGEVIDLEAMRASLESQQEEKRKRASKGEEESSSSRPKVIRTAKAERRFKDRLSKEGGGGEAGTTNGREMSPSEARALQAEKRAAWRQARLKSLEQDALQAQMVINRMSEIVESPPPSSLGQIPERMDTSPHSPTSSQGLPDHENNLSATTPTSPVETTESKIISIELESPGGGEGEGGETSETSPASQNTSASSNQSNLNSSKRRRKRNQRRK